MEDTIIPIKLLSPDKTCHDLISSHLTKSRIPYFTLGWENNLAFAQQELEDDRIQAFLLDASFGITECITLLRKSQANHLMQPVVIIKGEFTPEHREKFIQAGAAAMLATRDLDDNLLVDTILFAIANSQRAKAEIARLQQLNAQKEERYRLISEMLADYAYSYKVDENGTFSPEWTSENLVRMTGLTTSEDLDVFGGLLSMVVAEDAEKTFQMGKEALTGKPILSEFRILDPQGKERWIRNYIQPVVDESSQRVVHVYGAAQDITLQIETEESLQLNNEKLITWIDQLEKRNQETSLLNEMSELLQRCLTMDEAYAVIGKYCTQLFPGQPGGLFARSASKNILEAATLWNAGETQGEQALTLGDLVFKSEDCWAMRGSRPHLVHPDGRQMVCAHSLHRSAGSRGLTTFCIPLSSHGENSSLMHFQLNLEVEGSNNEQLAMTVSERAALALTNLRLRYELRQQSIRDPLTGLFNRRYMEETLERELRRAVRHNRPLSIIMIDLDHFKKFNDAYGHEAGDKILVSIGSFLRRNVRKDDVACRYGGEEFTLILPESDLLNTAKRANIILSGLREITIQYQDYVIGQITASMGVASYPQDGEQVVDLFRAADRALYEAKHLGRNRIETSKSSQISNSITDEIHTN